EHVARLDDVRAGHPLGQLAREVGGGVAGLAELTGRLDEPVPFGEQGEAVAPRRRAARQQAGESREQDRALSQRSRTRHEEAPCTTRALTLYRLAGPRRLRGICRAGEAGTRGGPFSSAHCPRWPRGAVRLAARS